MANVDAVDAQPSSSGSEADTIDARVARYVYIKTKVVVASGNDRPVSQEYWPSILPIIYPLRGQCGQPATGQHGKCKQGPPWPQTRGPALGH